jgi:hypothetical protein
VTPAKPYHVNFPFQREFKNIHPSERFYEVVGHRDGPVVARFYFYDEDTMDLAIAEARALEEKNRGP